MRQLHIHKHYRPIFQSAPLSTTTSSYNICCISTVVARSCRILVVALRHIQIDVTIWQVCTGTAEVDSIYLISVANASLNDTHTGAKENSTYKATIAAVVMSQRKPQSRRELEPPPSATSSTSPLDLRRGQKRSNAGEPRPTPHTPPTTATTGLPFPTSTATVDTSHNTNNSLPAFDVAGALTDALYKNILAAPSVQTEYVRMLCQSMLYHIPAYYGGGYAFPPPLTTMPPYAAANPFYPPPPPPGLPASLINSLCSLTSPFSSHAAACLAAAASPPPSLSSTPWMSPPPRSSATTSTSHVVASLLSQLQQQPLPSNSTSIKVEPTAAASGSSCSSAAVASCDTTSGCAACDADGAGLRQSAGDGRCRAAVAAVRSRDSVASPASCTEACSRSLTCSCDEHFENLTDLCIHIKNTQHATPEGNKSKDSPKLVRGQDMWMNNENEQSHKILCCLKCQKSFKELVGLTLHMLETKHYQNLVHDDTLDGAAGRRCPSSNSSEKEELIDVEGGSGVDGTKAAGTAGCEHHTASSTTDRTMPALSADFGGVAVPASRTQVTEADSTGRPDDHPSSTATPPPLLKMQAFVENASFGAAAALSSGTGVADAGGKTTGKSGGGSGDSEYINPDSGFETNALSSLQQLVDGATTRNAAAVVSGAGSGVSAKPTTSRLSSTASPEGTVAGQMAAAAAAATSSHCHPAMLFNNPAAAALSSLNWMTNNYIPMIGAGVGEITGATADAAVDLSSCGGTGGATKPTTTSPSTAPSSETHDRAAAVTGSGGGGASHHHGPNTHRKDKVDLSLKKARCNYCGKPFANKGQVRLHLSKGKCPKSIAHYSEHFLTDMQRHARMFAADGGGTACLSNPYKIANYMELSKQLGRTT